jgi:hypothetical protein
LCCRGASAGARAYCANCDLLVGLDGLHVVRVVRDDGDRLLVTVESAPEPVGSTVCMGHDQIQPGQTRRAEAWRSGAGRGRAHAGTGFDPGGTEALAALGQALGSPGWAFA